MGEKLPYVGAAGQHAGLGPELVEALVAAAKTLDGDRAACSLAWHVFHRLSRASSFDSASVACWPVSIASLGDDGGLLYQLALLGGLPGPQALHRRHPVVGSWCQGGFLDAEQLTPLGPRWIRLTDEDRARLDGTRAAQGYGRWRLREAQRVMGLSQEELYQCLRDGTMIAYRAHVGDH